MLVLVGALTQGASPVEVRPAVDVTLTAAAFGVLALLNGAARPALPHGYVCGPEQPSEPCDPSLLNALDRKVIGNRSDAWAVAGDVGVGALFLGAGAGALFDAVLLSDNSDGRALAGELLVLAEAVGASLAVTHTLRYAVRRPRPLQYLPEASQGTAERHLSFPSGHATAAAAGAAAYATLFGLRHPDSPWRYVVAGAGAALAVGVAYSRVAAGMHFPTDVAAGLGVGAALGVVVPLLHTRDDALQVSLAPTSGGVAANLIAAF